MMRYTILDPTGNITALVESPAAPAERPAAATALMRRHPQVEQVGFVRFADAESEGVDAALSMAGGEFCGNASLCAAALYLLRRGTAPGARERVWLRVSGASGPVETELRAEGENRFSAWVRMPRALGTEEQSFSFEGMNGDLTLVRMEGISHLIVPADSVFFALLSDRSAAERAVRQWCTELRTEGLGLMFLEEGESLRLTPLVYVPGSGTVFWENSCASGSSAVGMALAARNRQSVDLTLTEPGGTLRVASDPASGETRLCGTVRLIGEYEI